MYDWPNIPGCALSFQMFLHVTTICNSLALGREPTERLEGARLGGYDKNDIFWTPRYYQVRELERRELL